MENRMPGGFLDLTGQSFAHLFLALKDKRREIDAANESGTEEIHEQFKIDLVQYYTDNGTTGKKHVIQIHVTRRLKFIVEFYPNKDDKTAIDFLRNYCTQDNQCFYFSIISVQNENAGRFASKWFANLLSQQELYFDQVLMEILQTSENSETRFSSVQTLHITIPNESYEDGLLEWWLKKFEINSKDVLITSMTTQKICIPDKPDLFCTANLHLKGLFEIPITLFPKTTATNIEFEDLSETSIVTFEFVSSILDRWFATLETQRNITFLGNYGEADIEQKIEAYLKENTTLQLTDNLRREYLLKNGKAKILFTKSDKSLFLSNIPINPEVIIDVSQL